MFPRFRDVLVVRFKVINPKMYPFLAFLIPLAVRAVPELLMGPYIVGFDPVGFYVPTVLTWMKKGVNFWEYIAIAPLFYTVLMQLTSLGIPLTLSLKIIPPILHGFLALGVYFYANSALSWSNRKSLLVALLATSYFVALRISWDALRIEFSLILLFVTLAILQNQGNWKHYMLLLLTMTLVVLSHQLVTVIMFVIIATTTMYKLINNKHREARNLILASVPAALLFFLIVYANFITAPGFVIINDFPRKKSEGWFSLFGFASYQDMAVDILGFLFFCYLPILPLVVIGAKHFKNLPVKVWVLWSLIVILFPLISPNAFISWGWRWTLLLTYPFAFYATEGLAHLKSNLRQLIYVAMLLTMTSGFVAMSCEYPFPYYLPFPNYMPSSMLQNTIPLSDCPDTINALRWFRSSMTADAHLLTHRAFYGWALLVLNEDQILHYDYENSEKAAQKAFEEAYNNIYLIWRTNGSGWHGEPTVSSSFEEVRRFGQIVIYNYTEN